jgi:DNA-binding IclR family transcriptional regulator
MHMTNGRLKARGRAPRQGGQAIRRALGVLRTLAIGGEKGVPLAEIVQATSLARPTVHRIVHVLIEEGIVERSERTGNYVVGRQVPELALARPSRSPLMVAAEPYLAEASAQLGDTLFLTVRTGLDTLCVARRIGGYPIQVLSIEVGVRRPLGVSSAGDTRRDASCGATQDRARQRNTIWRLSDRYGHRARADPARAPPGLQSARCRPGAGNEVAFGLDTDAGRRASRGNYALGHPKQVEPAPRDRGGRRSGGYRARDRGRDAAGLDFNWTRFLDAHRAPLRLRTL